MIVSFDDLPAVIKRVIQTTGTKNGSFKLVDFCSDGVLCYSWNQCFDGSFEYGIVSECLNLKGFTMKRYKIQCNGGEYSEKTEDFPQWLWDMINTAGIDSGSVSIPSPYGGEIVYHWSLIPEQYFPEDMIDTIHRIAAELRSMAEMVDGIDFVQFGRTITILQQVSSRLTSAAKRETERNEVLGGDRIELKDESSGLCPYHTVNKSGFHSYLNPDCLVCEREIDRQNAESDFYGGGIESDDMFEE